MSNGQVEIEHEAKTNSLHLSKMEELVLMGGTYKGGYMLSQRAQETDPCRCSLRSFECGKLFAKEMIREKIRETEGAMKRFDMIINRNILHEWWENVSHGPVTNNAFRYYSNTKNQDT